MHFVYSVILLMYLCLSIRNKNQTKSFSFLYVWMLSIYAFCIDIIYTRTYIKQQQHMTMALATHLNFKIE